ncbi:hypothetical protein QBC47DRAFT_410728 [Echria macrotheca]|uniref:Uncharacterized protein n=1 Tax=Echria macrotheca TaxID=438768 RepID=A0AAJ0BGR9_9PEZI|nr:hypothetical protein QBC47DRAFT_410728 [Echria macrotheca]
MHNTMPSQRNTPPFTSPVLQAGEPSISLADHFPASFREDEDLIAAPGAVPPLDHIRTELDPSRVHGMTQLLWLAGRPVPPRPLHHQLLLGRDIVLSERIDIHLVWGKGRLFVKPLPGYLLDSRFWSETLVCSCPAMQLSGREQGEEEEEVVCLCGRRRLRQCAKGLLLHYTALIVYESDFTIALEKRLIPRGITWSRWRRFVREMLHGDDDHNRETWHREIYADVAERFIYGELRLNRLNLIQLLRRGPFSKHFLATWNSYGSFYRDNWAFIVGATAWILLILSAMQVGLGTERLSSDDAFQAASYGFTVFSILGPMAIFTVMMIMFTGAMVYNLFRTWRFERRREQKLGRTWRIMGNDSDGMHNVDGKAASFA